MSFSNSIRSRAVSAFAFALSLCALNVQVQASAGYTEIADFSNNSSSPTVITPGMQLGTNIVSGLVDASQWGSDEDFVRVTLPPASRLSKVRITVSDYRSTQQGSAGMFEILPSEQGNIGGVSITADTTQDIAFSIGTPTNIVLHIAAPFVFEYAGSAFFKYQVELVVSPIEVIGGTQICTAVEVTFPTEANSYYQVQCTSDMAVGDWVNLGQPVLGTGAVMSAFDTTRRASQQFYRVVRQ